MKKEFINGMMINEQKKYHLGLHSDIKKMYSNVKVKQTDKSTLMFGSELISDKARKQFTSARVKFIEKNMSSILSLIKECGKINSRLHECGEIFKAQVTSNQKLHAIFYKKKKELAKKLDVHKFLTDKGQFSEAKIHRQVGSGKVSLDDIKEKIYKEYDPLRKKLADDLNKKFQKPSKKVTEAHAEYKKLLPKYKKLKKEIYSLSANMLDSDCYESFCFNSNDFIKNLKKRLEV